MTAAGYPNAAGAEVHQREHRRHRLPDLDQDARPRSRQEGRRRCSTRRFGNGPNAPGTKNFSSTSIGPTFGKTVANSAVIAIIASLLVISAYIALRFEWKYAVPVLIALMHDLLITAGVYSLTGREVTTATVAALLTILGYSLYDTIIVFDRVRENVPRMPRAAFSQIVNRSMSEVLTRSLATSFCTLLPVHRAAAVRRRNAEGLRVRADGRDRLRRVLVDLHRLARADALEGARGRLPHTAARGSCANSAPCRPMRRPSTGAPEDVEPAQKRRRTRRGSLIAPEQPGEQISARRVPGARARPRRRGRAARLRRAGARARGPARRGVARRRARGGARGRRAPERDPAADLTPEDLVLKEPSRKHGARTPHGGRGGNRRHGRSR